jgi:hypothetical protein
MQHCAFVVTPQRLAEIEQRLKSRGIEYLGPIPQLPGLVGIYLLDPNGIRLEFACQPADGDAQQVLKCNRQTEEELRRELQTLENKP